MVTLLFGFTASATDLRERFLQLEVFNLTLLPAGFKASLGAGSSTSKLARLYADFQNITLFHKRGVVVGSIYGLRLADYVKVLWLIRLATEPYSL